MPCGNRGFPHMQILSVRIKSNHDYKPLGLEGCLTYELIVKRKKELI